MTPTEIRATRAALGLTQAELAALVGITRGYLATIETGRKSPDGATARLLSILDVPGVVDRLRSI